MKTSPVAFLYKKKLVSIYRPTLGIMPYSICRTRDCGKQLRSKQTSSRLDEKKLFLILFHIWREGLPGEITNKNNHKTYWKHQSLRSHNGYYIIGILNLLTLILIDFFFQLIHDFYLYTCLWASVSTIRLFKRYLYSYCSIWFIVDYVIWTILRSRRRSWCISFFW